MASEHPLAIQFSDLRGFTSFTAQRGDQEAFRVAQDFVGLVEEQVGEHGGRMLKTYGDGVMTSFADAAGALRSSAAVQRMLCDRYCEEEDAAQISAGVGLTWGEAIRTEGDLFGHSVNLAKRLADVAKGGQIVASSSVLDQAGELEHIDFRDLGERQLKGIGSEHLFEVVWREEAAKLSLTDDSLDLVLTEDEKVVLEFAKPMKDKVMEAVRSLEAEGADGKGLEALIRRSVAKTLARRLPKWIDWAGAKAGMGMQHAIDDVEAAIREGKLVISLGGHKTMRFSKDQINPESAREFVERLQRMKARGGRGA